MGSLCLSAPAILRCESFTSLQNQVLLIPTGVELLVTSALLFARYQGSRRHLLIVLEGWAYFALALLEMLSHILPAAREDPNVFRIMDTVLAAAALTPLFLYMTFLYLLTHKDLLPLFPKRFQRLIQFLLLLSIPTILTLNTLAGFIGVSRRTIQLGPLSVIAIGFANQRDSMFWMFFTSFALALYSAYQAVVFVLVFYRLLRAFLDQRRIETADADEAHFYNGTGWISAAIKIGAIETALGFIQEGFAGVITRRILRLLARGILVIGVFKGLDAAEDFTEIRRELSSNRRKGFDRQSSSMRRLITPQVGTFRQLSPTATAFHSHPRAVNGQTGDPYAMGASPQMQQFADVRDRRQRVTVVFSQGAPTLQMRFSALDMPSPATIADKVKSRPPSEWMSTYAGSSSFSRNNSATALPQSSLYSAPAMHELASQFPGPPRPPPSAVLRDHKGKQPVRDGDARFLTPTPQWGGSYASSSRTPSFIMPRPSPSLDTVVPRAMPTPSPALADDNHLPIDPFADEDEDFHIRRESLGDEDWEQIDDDALTHSTHVTQTQFADYHTAPIPDHMLQHLPPPAEIQKIQLQFERRMKEAELARLAQLQQSDSLYQQASRQPSESPSPSHLFSSRPATGTTDTDVVYGYEEDKSGLNARVISTIAEVDEPSYKNKRTSAWVSSNGKSTEDVNSLISSTSSRTPRKLKRRPPPLRQSDSSSLNNNTRTRSRSRTIDSEDGTLMTSKSTDALSIPWLRNLPTNTNPNTIIPRDSTSSQYEEQRRHEEREAELARALGGSNLASQKPTDSQVVKITNIGNAPIYNTPKPMRSAKATSGVASLYLQPVMAPSRDSGLGGAEIEYQSRTGTSSSRYSANSRPGTGGMGFGVTLGFPPGGESGGSDPRNEFIRRDSEVLPEAQRSYRR